MTINAEKLKDLFIYHPPQTQERIDQHKAVDQACVDFGIALSELVKDEAAVGVIVRKILDVRHEANLAITHQEAGRILGPNLCTFFLE